MPYFKVSGVVGAKNSPRSEFLRAKNAKAAENRVRRNGVQVKQVEQVEIFHVVTQVAGASYDNRDGSSRQSIIRRCKPSERLTLQHERNNRHDKHAIRVNRGNGEQVGYLPQEVAADIHDGFLTEGGCKTSIISTGTSNLSDDGKLLTLGLSVVVALNSVPDEAVRDYLESCELGLDVGSFMPMTNLESVHVDESRSQATKKKGAPHTRSAKPKRSGCLLLIGLLVASILITVSGSVAMR